jgi:hypothetical protein
MQALWGGERQTLADGKPGAASKRPILRIVGFAT